MSFKFTKDLLYKDDPRIQEKDINDFAPYYEKKYEILLRENPKAKKIAEIGNRTGYSLYAFAQAVPKAEIHGYDPHNGTHGGQGGEDFRFRDFSKELLKDYNLTLFLENTQKLKKLNESGYDFIHVDGDHTVEGVQHDLDISLKALNSKKASFLLIDDYTFLRSVRTGVDQWLEKNSDKVEWKFEESLRGEIIIRKKK